MAEPKGGPVKPPTLDLKPRQASTPKSDKSGAPKRRVKTATPAGAPKNNSPTSAQSEETRKSTAAHRASPHSANAKPDTPQSGAPPRSAAPQSSAPKTNRSPQPKSWLTPTLAAIFGAIGGVILSLFLIIPIIMSGIFQPDNQTQTRIAALQENLGAAQNLSNQNQIGVDGLDEQVDILRQDLMQQQTLVEDRLSQLTQMQQDLLARQTSNEASIEEQVSALSAQLDATNAATPPAAPIPFDPTPLQRQITDLGAKLDAVAAGASNEDAQKLSADIAQVQTRLNAIQTQLSQQVQGSDTQISQLATRLDEQRENIETISTLLASNTDQLSQQDMSLSALSLTSAELLQSTQDLQKTTEEIALAAKSAEETVSQTQNSFAPTTQIQQIPFALMSIEIALNNGQPFLYQLESLAAQTNDLSTPPELLHAAAEGLGVPSDIAIEFNRLIPIVLSARPSDPDAGFIDQIGESIKSILGLRATGLENGDEFENLLNQSLAAIKVSNFSEAQALLNNLPSPMRDNLGQLNQQIELHADIQSLMSTVSDAHLAGEFSNNAPTSPTAPAEAPPTNQQTQPAQTGPDTEQQPTPADEVTS